jgi:PAS domain-containing protein
VRAHYIPLARQRRSVIGVLVMLVDVQQLKDTENALAERERQLSLIMDSVGFPITYIDRAGVIRFANKPSCEWSGRTLETMVGKNMEEIAPPAVMSAVRPLYARALAGRARHLRARGALAGAREAALARPPHPGPRRVGRDPRPPVGPLRHRRGPPLREGAARTSARNCSS